MAVYKVPQDVEADDKLIGPFSFRQFVYLAIVAGAMAMAWFMANLFLPLAIIPLPIIVLFGALALPLKKDQPMETYLAALVSFYFKPRRRMWDPDGQQALVEIIAPKVVEVQRTKGLSEMEAERRLSYLANIVDSRGWAVRGVQTSAPADTAVAPDVYYEAQQAEDVMDDSTATSRGIDSRLDQAAAKHREELVQQMKNPAPLAPPPIADPYKTLSQPAPATGDEPSLTINPYPSNMHQAVIQPLSGQPSVRPQSAQSPSPDPVSPDIINLANNPDLSIETIAHEASRIKEKQGLPEDEVMVSLH